MNTLCLLFITSLQQPIYVPDHVKNLVQSRITHQWTQTHSDTKIYFDKSPSKCAHKGNYFFSADSIVMNAQNPFWSGRLELGTSELIEGQKIQFPLNPMEIAVAKEEFDKAKRNTDTFDWNWKKIAIGVVGASLVSIGAYHGYKSLKKNSGGSPSPARHTPAATTTVIQP